MSKIEKTDLINTNNISTKYGLIAGGLMAVALFLFQVTGNDFSPFLKLSKYILLALSIVIALNIYKDKIKGNIFFNGLAVGTKLSFIAGLLLVVINFLLFFTFPSVAFSKYGIEPSSLKQVTMISGVLFFESLVFGSLITFAVLQYLKDGGEVKEDKS
ncbi:MAG: hypothetical protein ACI9P5_003766 [Saprospiraceae bacterium]|jgi:hypothetical protein|tara:strand:- start:1359 stop:1832 length:474 start_codon:yes stop_codon:yes gene_type:complete